MRLTARLTGVILILLAIGVLGPPWWDQVSRAPATPVESELVDRARADLARVAVVEPLPMTDYDRSFFGPAWQGLEGGCDTRNRVLAAWLTDAVLEECSVMSGAFTDPYTGHLIEFTRGPRTSSEVHVDHVVALADAWVKGAAHWPPARAQAFANDPLNLVPTQGWVNEAKGALDAGDWLPANEGFWCYFAVQQVLVKSKYGLGVTDSEVAGLVRGLDRC